MKIDCTGELKIKFKIIEEANDVTTVFNDEKIKDNIINFVKEELKESLGIEKVELLDCKIIKKM